MTEQTTFPTHCAACGHRLHPSPERGKGDAVTAEYPYCRSCHYEGASYAHIHASTLGTLRAYGLRASWWNTGGGCWILAIVRDAAPEAWAEQGDGVFLPFVAAGEAVEADGAWHWESGPVNDPSATWGATYYASEDEWCGELGTETAEVAPTDAHGLARFALEHLPPVRPVVPKLAEDLTALADVLDKFAFDHHGLDAATLTTLRDAEGAFRATSTDLYVAANPGVHPDAL